MISVLIIIKNQAELIETCLKSVSWAGEVVVVDTGSTDQTIERAKKMGAKVFEYKGSEQNFSSWRNFGLTKITGDWLFALDSDERVLADLAAELQDIDRNNADLVAWKVARRNIILGKELKYGAFWPDYVIRFFKTDHLKGWHGLVHEQPDFDGDLGTLKHSLIHLTHRDIDSMIIKSLDWAQYDAKLRLQSNHPPMSGWRFLRIMVTETWKQGITRGGFFGGTEGVIDALLQVFSMYISYVKLWQLQHKPSLAETYKDIDRKLLRDGFK